MATSVTVEHVSTVVVGEQDWLTEVIERRRALGQDKRDEVWEGVYHVAPLEHSRNGALAVELAVLLNPGARQHGLRVVNPFNLGEPNDYRGPDLGLLRRDQPLALYMPTAELVIEVLSPDDESWQKLPHYAAHDVGEVWMVDPIGRTVQMLVLDGATYRESDHSPLTLLTAVEVQLMLDWPDS